MKAIRVSCTGGPDVLSYQEVPDPQPKSGEILVRIETAGVNFIDTYHREGLYPLELPFTPGIEAAGTVEALGEGVESLQRGERVVFCLAIGGYAEMACVEAWKAIRLPDTVSSAEGVTAMCQGMTAHYLTTDCYALKAGDTALVHAAAGGVGLLLTQMCKGIGADVIGTVSTPEKARLAEKVGVDHVVLYTECDFESEVKRLTEDKGVQVVYESVGKSTFEKSLNCLAPRGYMVLFGQSSGPVDPLDPQVLNQKGSIFLTRPSLFHYSQTPDEFKMRASAVLGMIETGDLRISIGETLPLSEASLAHRKLEARETVGKVLLTP